MSYKIVFLDINESIKKLGNNNREDLYQCTRKYWKLSPQHASQADYIVGFADNEIKTIYRASKWEKIADCRDLLNDTEVIHNPNYKDTRYAFEGKSVNETEFKKISAELTKDIPKSRQNPVHYNFKALR